MATLKEDVFETARILIDVEHGGRPLSALHDHLRRCLYRHRKALGLSDTDVAQIDNTDATLGGTPKGPPPEDP